MIEKIKGKINNIISKKWDIIEFIAIYATIIVWLIVIFNIDIDKTIDKSWNYIYMIIVMWILLFSIPFYYYILHKRKEYNLFRFLIIKSFFLMFLPLYIWWKILISWGLFSFEKTVYDKWWKKVWKLQD